MTLMASYSSWQGVKMHANRPLLTDILKGRLGFEGFVIGDWDGHARVPGCRSDHCPQAINAGVDMFMAPYHWKELYENTLADVRSGAIPAARLDDAVRRILRVKLKLGLFEADRPYEGRFELLNSSAAHALAREAVRKSLVLLKNGGVLPIRPSARVLVTGPGADNLPMQCGGWSLTWQTSDTTNADFPAGESIRTAFERALKSSGGRLVDGTDLIGADRPDVAVVVYGEQPYAENHGDVKLAIYNDREMLEQLWQLRDAGIPTVSIVLSGRPLWMNPEIDASNAFVAAWLPGTEGGGIADVLIGDAEGRPRFDFSGRLPFHWPNGPYPPNTGHADRWRNPGRWDTDSVTRRRRHPDIAIVDATRLAALKVDRPGQRLMAVECAARDARNLLIVDERHAIEHDGHAAADERDVVGPPGSGLARGGCRGREISVDAAQAPLGRVRLGLVFDLHFIASPQVHAAVRSRRAVEFDMQLEVVERPIAHQIGAAPGTRERSAFDPPRIRRAGIRQMPATEILAIEQVHRRSPLRCRLRSSDGARSPRQLQGVPSGPLVFPTRTFPCKPPFENHVAVRASFLFLR